MMFFKRKIPLIKVNAVGAPRPPLRVEIVAKTAKKPDRDGKLRRMQQIIEDNRLL